jgi:N-acetylmuramoyl-L-alanine amidase
MKKPIVLAIFILVVSGALGVAQEANRPPSGSPVAQAAQSAPKDQPAKPAQDQPQKVQEKKPSEAPKFSKAQIIKVQKALQRYDYYDGPIDGKMNPDLRQAIKDFQEDEGLDMTGELDEETYKRVLALLEDESGEEPPSEEPPSRS